LHDLTSEEIIRASIRPGTVFYFADDRLSPPLPHYFIVINLDPETESVILLLCASSQIQNVELLRIEASYETLVIITPEEYPDFSKRTIVDCNTVFDTQLSKIVEKYSSNELAIQSDLDEGIVKKLRNGVLVSRLVSKKIQQMLKR
jgi:hypothetical protein